MRSRLHWTLDDKCLVVGQQLTWKNSSMDKLFSNAYACF